MSNLRQLTVRWVGKEAVRYQLGPLAADVQCYFDPERKSYLAVLRDMGMRHGQIVRLTAEEMNEVEVGLRDYLGSWRFLGLRLGTYEVTVEREQHAF